MKKETVLKTFLVLLAMAALFAIGLKIGKYYGTKQKKASTGSVK